MHECPNCHEGELREQLVETWLERDGTWVLFKNVCALVCDVCGDRGFSQDVSERMARTLTERDRRLPSGAAYYLFFDLALTEQVRANVPDFVTGGSGLPAANSVVRFESSSVGVPLYQDTTHCVGRKQIA